ncbi:MAG: AEC family transporter [Mariprofundaceae bacterium]|nr:AEC family transporter [Mariprofundaceae bacterium]
MLATLIGMAAIIAAGLLWRVLLGGKDAETIRGHLAQAVYTVFLPALVLHVMWQTTINLDVLRVPVVAAVGVLLSLLLAALIYGDGKRVGGKKAVGALLLAAAFGNVTYLGLPVLTKTFGAWSQSVAIPYDLFANTPLLFTVGVMLAGHFGSAKQAAHPLIELLRVPALWGAVGGVLLSLLAVPMPIWLDESLAVLGAAVVPLMLLSIGMALRWQSGWMARAPVLLPVVVIQLVLMPIVVWAACIGVGMPEKLLAPTVIEGAMPCMVLGLVICDRFRLDSSLYAEAVTLTTVLSMLTLPLWLRILG